MKALQNTNQPESTGFAARLIYRTVNYLRQVKPSSGRAAAARR